MKKNNPNADGKTKRRKTLVKSVDGKTSYIFDSQKEAMACMREVTGQTINASRVSHIQTATVEVTKDTIGLSYSIGYNGKQLHNAMDFLKEATPKSIEGMTVFNSREVDTKKQPMFFGQPLGVQRYDSYKYPFLKNLHQQQIGYFWQPEDDLSTERQGGLSEVTP